MSTPAATPTNPPPIPPAIVSVRAESAALWRRDRPGLCGQVRLQELRERPLADETDAGAVALVVDGQGVLVRDAAHLALGQRADRKQRPREHGTGDGVQEVTLVLVRVDPAQQPAAFRAGVVARREQVCAEAQRVLEAHAELDFPVAGDVRVRRPPGAQFVEEMREDAVAVLGGERDGVQRQLQVVAHLPCVLQVCRGRAVTVLVLVPVAHEQRVHVVPGLLEQHRGNGGIDATGEG